MSERLRNSRVNLNFKYKSRDILTSAFALPSFRFRVSVRRIRFPDGHLPRYAHAH